MALSCAEIISTSLNTIFARPWPLPLPDPIIFPHLPALNMSENTVNFSQAQTNALTMVSDTSGAWQQWEQNRCNLTTVNRINISLLLNSTPFAFHHEMACTHQISVFSQGNNFCALTSSTWANYHETHRRRRSLDDLNQAAKESELNGEGEVTDWSKIRRFVGQLTT